MRKLNVITIEKAVNSFEVTRNIDIKYFKDKKEIDLKHFALGQHIINYIKEDPDFFCVEKLENKDVLVKGKLKIRNSEFIKKEDKTL